jgi:hypothetical protein
MTAEPTRVRRSNELRQRSTVDLSILCPVDLSPDPDPAAPRGTVQKEFLCFVRSLFPQATEPGLKIGLDRRVCDFERASGWDLPCVPARPWDVDLWILGLSGGGFQKFTRCILSQSSLDGATVRCDHESTVESTRIWTKFEYFDRRPLNSSAGSR